MTNAVSLGVLAVALVVASAATAASTPPVSAWHSAAAVQARAEPFDGSGHQMTPGWVQVVYERNGYNYTLLDTFELNCVFGDSRMPLAYFSSKLAHKISKELADTYVPVWCKYFDALEPTKATKPENSNQFIVTYGLFPRISSTPTMYDGYDYSVPFLTSRLAFAVPRISSVLPARDTLSYSKAKQLMSSNINEYEWTFWQDGLLEKNLKSELYGMLPKSEFMTMYKNAKRTSLADFYTKVARYDPAGKNSNSKPPVMIGELPSLRYFQQYNNYCDKMKIIETFIEANAYSLGVRFPPIVVDKDIYDAFRTAVDQAVLKTTLSGEIELLTQQILNSESTCLEERRAVTVSTLEIPPFVERQADGSYTGLCIDILNQVENDTGIQFEYRPINTRTKKWSKKTHSRQQQDTYYNSPPPPPTPSKGVNPFEKIIDKVYHGETHMGIGPLTITPERALAVDFSTPFMTTELGAMLPANYTDVYTLTDIIERNFRIIVARGSPVFELLMTSEAPALRMLGERIVMTPDSIAEAIELLATEPYVVVVDDYVSLKRNTMMPTTTEFSTRSASPMGALVNAVNSVIEQDDDMNADTMNEVQQQQSFVSGNAPPAKVVRFGTYSSSSHYAFVFPKISGRKYTNEKFIDRLRDTVSNKIEEMLRNGQIAELTDRYFGNL